MNCFARLATFAMVVAGLAPTGLLAEEASNSGPYTAIEGPRAEERGQWRTKVQLVFEETTRTLTRRPYVVWDAAPARNLDFTWQPSNPASDKPGRIGGLGHLVWRVRSKPAYDPTSIIAEYSGTMHEGRIEGQGTYLDNTGLKYGGQWRKGLMDGRGTLQLPAGDEYVGQFAKGKANGDGRLIDITGEIYEGTFANGMKNGRGTTTLPNGVSYPSSWAHGKENDQSRRVRVAQTGWPSIFEIFDDVRIGIGIERRFPSQVEADGASLWYRVSNSNSGFEIRPDNKRILNMWQGKDEIQLTFRDEREDQSVLDQKRRQIVPLNLRIELQNRSNSPIQMTGLYLDVQSSSTELKPAIQIRTEAVSQCAGVSYSSGFTIENFGWSTANDAILKLTPPTADGTSINITKKLGTLDRTIRVDIDSDLRAMGVDTDYFSNQSEGIDCGSISEAACLDQLRGSGRLGRLGRYVRVHGEAIVLNLSGQLDYSWKDNRGSLQKTTHPFKAALPLGHPYKGTECGEMGASQIITTKTQQFRLDAANYRIPITHQASVPPSQAIPLVFAVDAAKSSTHNFVVVVRLSNGREIRSRPITLLYYRPSWFRKDFGGEEIDDGQNVLFRKFDLDGAVLRTLRGADVEKCQATCENDSKCVGYSQNRFSEECVLKSEVASMHRDPRVSSALKRGIGRPMLSTRALVVKRFSKMTFGGMPYLAALKSSFDECEQKCKDEKGCAAFNFVNTTNICYLMDELRSIEPEESDPTTNSGLIFQSIN